MTNDRRKSDSLVVPKKPPNDAAEPATEVVEGSELAKGNSPDSHGDRTQGRIKTPDGLERVRQAARKDRKQRFTALLHHVYDLDRLRAAYVALKRDAAPGVDGETWRHDGEALEANLRNLAARLKRGAFRASPVRRAYIPKADGRQRPLGVPTLEDKLVQRAVVDTMNAIYEQDFLGFSYGFRPSRSPHDALDALTVGVETRRVNWVLDADIRGFFDTLNHGWLVRFVEHRVADRRVVRLIQKWLRAGVLEDGQRTRREVGTVQGGSLSPLLANIYLHYVFDLWVQRWRGTQARGDVVAVRFADDSSWDSSIGRKPNASARSCANASRDSGWRCIPTRRASSSSAATRREPDEDGATGNPRPSISSASRIAAGRPGRAGSRCCAKPCASGGKRSCRRSRPNCGDACTTPFRTKEPSCARCCSGTPVTTGCRATGRV